jgi:hypothetical protein
VNNTWGRLAGTGQKYKVRQHVERNIKSITVQLDPAQGAFLLGQPIFVSDDPLKRYAGKEGQLTQLGYELFMVALLVIIEKNDPQGCVHIVTPGAAGNFQGEPCQVPVGSNVAEEALGIIDSNVYTLVTRPEARICLAISICKSVVMVKS